MFGLIKRVFHGLLTDVSSASNHTMCISLSNQKCMTQSALNYLHPKEYSQEFHYYPIHVRLN